jgi:4-hydroxy-4-methyl-2-oxoglutarate aldolase
MTEEIWAKLRDINLSTISDILNSRRVFNHVMRADIQALEPTMRICGFARTLSSRPRQGSPEPGHEYALLFGAIDSLKRGEVLVTDRTDCCVWGELCSEAAMRRGGNGIVIDGFTRDSAAICEQGFPLFGRGRHMSDMLYHRTIVALDQAVVCGEVLVNPGDLVLGAEDGVLVVPAGLVEEVVLEAVGKSVTETEVRRSLRAGMSVSEAYARFGVM